MTEDERRPMSSAPFNWSNDRTVRTKRYHLYLSEIEVEVSAERVDSHEAGYLLTIKRKNGHNINPQLTSAQMLEVFQAVTLMMSDFEGEAGT